MKFRTKKLVAIFLMLIVVLVACLGISFSFVACGEKLYDVEIRVGCSDGKIYEFPIGTDELHVTIPYDGIERTYWVDSYQLVDHPALPGWFAPTGSGPNVFQLSMIYGNEQSWLYEVDKVCEQGRYCINIYADSTSTLWHHRSCYLFIDVI